MAAPPLPYADGAGKTVDACHCAQADPSIGWSTAGGRAGGARRASRRGRSATHAGVKGLPASPDHFQRRTYVRLPFADEYLERRDERLWQEELRRAFAKPRLTVRISPEEGYLPASSLAAPASIKAEYTSPASSRGSPPERRAPARSSPSEEKSVASITHPPEEGSRRQ